MAAGPDSYNGQKIIYKHSAGLVWSIILSFLAIGVIACTFFFPYNGFINDVGAPAAVTGLDFIYYGIAFFTGGNHAPMDNFTNIIFTQVFDSYGVAKVAINVFLFIMLIALAFMVIFSVILLIGCIIGLCRGRMKNYKFFYSFVKRIFLYSMPFYGAIILINIYNGLIKGMIFPGSTTAGSVFQSYYTYFFFGSLFLLTIVVHIIYSKTMKNRVYIKDEEAFNQYVAEYEAENTTVTDTTAPEDLPKEEAQRSSTKHESLTSDDSSGSSAEALSLKSELPKPVDLPQEEKAESNESLKRLPKGLKHIGGHAFSQNTVLEEAIIPAGIDVLGPGAFANCVNLRIVYIPETVRKIEYNCFFNCIRLEKITYGGTREMWKKIKRGSNWLTAAGTNFVVCRDGTLSVNPAN